jgi:hypothetical protein
MALSFVCQVGHPDLGEISATLLGGISAMMAFSPL